jgi:hypothetical protein
VSDFPTDEVTLTLLISACEINPDTGQTHLHDFLSMGSRVKSVEQTQWSDPPVFEVEHEEGFAPFSPQQVIATLAQELLDERNK